MMNEMEKNLQNMEFRQKQIVMMGGGINQQTKKLSPAEIEQMKKNYVAMYYGFVSINWGMGKTLGVSWQKALEQMDGFVMSKTKIPNHPGNTELVKFHKEFRRDMAKSIMMNPYSSKKLNEVFKKSFVEYGTKRVKESKAVLDEMYKRYMPVTNVKPSSNDIRSFDVANRILRQRVQNMFLQNNYQRVA